MHENYVDILVIGAGPAGVISAAIAQKNGKSVKVIEKAVFPRFVIGESLIPRVMDHLEEAGFIDVLNEMNFQKKFGARFVKNDLVCDFDFSDQVTPGWAWTWQCPRADFDHALVKDIIKRGIDVQFKCEVISVDMQGERKKVVIRDEHGNEEQLEAGFIIDASGYARVLPRFMGTVKESKLSPKKAMFVHCKDEKRPKGREGWMITFVVHRVDVWLWVIPFSNGNCSLGVVGNPDFFKEFEGSPEEVMRQIFEQDPNYRERFRGTELLWEPKSLEAYSASTAEMYGDGYAIVGNSVEFLDPVFSSGVMFAAETGNLATKLAIRQLNGEKVDWEKEYAAYVKKGVETFRTYVESWYNGALQDVFFAPNPNPKIKKQLSSILAGYVWDMKNPWVRNHSKLVYNVADMLRKNKHVLSHESIDAKLE